MTHAASSSGRMGSAIRYKPTVGEEEEEEKAESTSAMGAAVEPSFAEAGVMPSRAPRSVPTRSSKEKKEEEEARRGDGKLSAAIMPPMGMLGVLKAASAAAVLTMACAMTRTSWRHHRRLRWSVGVHTFGSSADGELSAIAAGGTTPSRGERAAGTIQSLHPPQMEAKAGSASPCSASPLAWRWAERSDWLCRDLTWVLCRWRRRRCCSRTSDADAPSTGHCTGVPSNITALMGRCAGRRPGWHRRCCDRRHG